MLLRERLADSLRRERRRLGWTQLETAQAAGLDVRHLQKIEAQDISTTLDTLEVLATAMGVDATRLLKRPRRR